MAASIAPALEVSPAALTPDQISRFHQDGYLAFADFLSPRELEGIKSALSETFRTMVEEVRAGKSKVERKLDESQKNYSGLRITASQGKHWILFEPDADLDVRT